jgi:hypothetical protein
MSFGGMLWFTKRYPVLIHPGGSEMCGRLIVVFGVFFTSQLQVEYLIPLFFPFLYLYAE